MKIADLRLFKFDVPLAIPLQMGKRLLTRRSGAVVTLVDVDGQSHAGEVSPLPGYSSESLDESIAQLRQLKWSLVGTELPQDIEELSGGMASWLGSDEYMSSVRFGLETAALKMLAHGRNVNLSRLLSDHPAATIPVNALLDTAHDDPVAQLLQRRKGGFATFKLKVGRSPLDIDIVIVNRLLDMLINSEALRLDANRAWSFDEAIRFCHGVDIARIEYIEEPLCEPTDLQALIRECPQMSIALDETLRDITPQDLSQFTGVRAVVLKPTVLGYERSMQFVRVASRIGFAAVFSATFETSLGLTDIAHLSAAGSSPPPASGLDTIRWFSGDLMREPIRIENGCIDIANLPTDESINWDQCEEIDAD